MSNFTKGPWRYAIRNINEIMQSFDAVVIGEVCVDIPTGSARADAHLIAAAPELYEQLDRLITFGQMHQLTELDIEPALEALAKARGEP